MHTYILACKLELQDAQLCGKKNQVSKLKNFSLNVNDMFSTKISVICSNNLCGNGPLKTVYKCKSKVCKLQMTFVYRNQALISEIKRFYDCIVPVVTIYPDCHSSNVIYLMVCNKCYMDYASEAE